MIPLSTEEKKRFADDGYLVIETGVDHSMLDAIVDALDPYWNGETPKGVSQADSSRVQDAWRVCDEVRVLATYPKILDTLRQLYVERPLPFQTLNFPKGTQQPTHSDSLHFNSEPFGMMCGVWVALEDIGMDQGPLVYYPGSHKLPEANFDEVGVEASLENYPKYLEFVEEKLNAHNFKASYGLLKKGQALVWAANLLHGGSRQNDPSLSRHSQVTHYYFDNGRYWRPSASREARFYFEPKWIPYPGDGKRMNRLLRPVRKLFHF